MRGKLLSCLSLLAVTLPVVAQPGGLTARQLIERKRPADVQLSPDGRYLAVQIGTANLKRNRVDSQIWIFETAADLTRPKITLPGASGLRWAPDSQSFALAQQGALKVGQPKSSALKTVFQGEWEGHTYSPDGQRLAFASPVGSLDKSNSGRLYDDLFLRRWNHYHDGRVRHLFVLPLDTLKAKDVTPGPRDAWPTSGAYSAGSGFCFSPDGKSLIFSAPPARSQASDTNYDIYRVQLGQSHWENLTPDNAAADMGPRLSADGKKLYIVSHRRAGYESDFSQVRSCPIDSSGRPSAAWSEENLGDGLVEFEDTPQGRAEVRSSAANSTAHWQGRQLPLQGAAHSLSTGGPYWACLEDGYAIPTRVALGRGEQVRHLEMGPLPKLGQVESFQVPVEGASMQSWLIKPPNYDPNKKWPVAVLVHGGPQGGWSQSWSLRWNPQVWAAAGYLVVMPNPRGSSGWGRAFQEQVSRDWGGLAYRDLMTCLDQVSARPDVDPQRMLAAGASFGGYMVNWFSVNTNRFRALITHCGVWNLESMYGTTDELWFADWEFGGPPWKEPRDYEQFSPHKKADQLGRWKTPHLVIHNDLDYRCPIDQGLQLFTALQRQGVPSKFLNFPDEGHWVLKPANSLRWYREVLEFAKTHCPS